MTTHEMAAAYGVVSQGLLAVLFTKVWSLLRKRWSLLLGLSFAVNALYYLRVAFGTYVEPLMATPQRGNAALVLTGLVLCTAGLLDYAGVHGRAAKRLNGLAAVVAALTFAGVASELLSRREGLSVWAGFLLAWALLFARTMLREPRRGHSFVMLALLSYPTIVIAVLHGDLGPEMLTAAHTALMAAVGMTLLTTGLLRAQWLAMQEGQRAQALLLARQRAEQQLLHANETLEHRVAVRTAELRETIEGLDSFNRTISHDLRGPLGGIVGVARLARDYVINGDRAAAERMLQAISAQAEMSQKLVGALLALARSSDATLQRQAVDTEALVLEVIESLRDASGSDTVRLSIVVSHLPPVDADPQLLRQVFVNLIGNALKFTAGAPRPHIEVGAASSSREGVTFHVRDNGVGFAPSDAARLFKPFQRLHGQRFEGFGVGLSIVRRIVERHGGQVWAEPNVGEGATFRFTVRAAEHAVTRASHEQIYVRGRRPEARLHAGAPDEPACPGSGAPCTARCFSKD